MDYIQGRQLKIHLLKMASSKVESGYFICGALSSCCYGRYTVYHQVDIYEAVAEIKHYIMKAIAPHSYYSRWLRSECPEIANSMTIQSYRQARLAWINWMIACYEEDIANYKENK